MKGIKTYLIAVIMLFLVLFFAASFTQVSFNIESWTSTARNCVGIFWVFGCCVLITIIKANK